MTNKFKLALVAFSAMAFAGNVQAAEKALAVKYLTAEDKLAEAEVKKQTNAAIFENLKKIDEELDIKNLDRLILEATDIIGLTFGVISEDQSEFEQTMKSESFVDAVTGVILKHSKEAVSNTAPLLGALLQLSGHYANLGNLTHKKIAYTQLNANIPSVTKELHAKTPNFDDPNVRYEAMTALQVKLGNKLTADPNFKNIQAEAIQLFNGSDFCIKVPGTFFSNATAKSITTALTAAAADPQSFSTLNDMTDQQSIYMLDGTIEKGRKASV